MTRVVAGRRPDRQFQQHLAVTADSVRPPKKSMHAIAEKNVQGEIAPQCVRNAQDKNAASRCPVGQIG